MSNCIGGKLNMNMRRIYYRELQNNGMINTEKCSSEEFYKYKDMKASEIPDNVDFANASESTGFYKYSKGELSDEELKIFALAKINSKLKFIKGCVIFFVVLAIIGIILGIIGVAQLSSAVHSASTSLFG